MKRTSVKTRVGLLLLGVVLMASLMPATALAATGDWLDFRGSADNNAVVSNATVATTAAEAELAWEVAFGDATASAYSTSDPLIVDDAIYLAVTNLDAGYTAVSSQLYKYNLDGTVAASVTLDGSLDYACRMLCIGDTVFVPLAGGQIAAYSTALDLQWQKSVVPVDGNFHQLCSTLTAVNGTICFGTVCYDPMDWTSSGVYLCIDASDGTILWTYPEEGTSGAGYYWNGGVSIGDYLVFTSSDGHVISVDASTGMEVADMMLTSAAISSTPVASGDDLYVSSKDGVLHKIAFNRSDGTFGTALTCDFADSSTSTPAVYDGKVYVGGGLSDYSGVMAVIDAQTMTVLQSEGVAASVQSSPLVVDNGAGVFAYFTANTTPGALYVLELGGEASVLYAPQYANYSTESALIDASGTLYYANDSGHLFAISKVVEGAAVVQPVSSGTADVLPKTGDDPLCLVATLGAFIGAGVLIIWARKKHYESQR